MQEPGPEKRSVPEAIHGCHGEERSRDNRGILRSEAVYYRPINTGIMMHCPSHHPHPARRARSHQKAYAFMFAFRGSLWADEQSYQSTLMVCVPCHSVAQFPPS